MGLLIFKERSPDDKSPFKRNEFHVGKCPSISASDQSSRIIGGRITRTTSSDGALERRMANRRSRGRASAGQSRTIRSQHYMHMLEHMSSPDYSNPERTSTDAPQGASREHASDPAYLQRSEEHFDTVDEALRISGRTADAVGRSASAMRMRHATSRNFAPARRYYEDLQREQYFDVTPARGRGQTSDSRPGSADGTNRWRVTSPDTQQAIFRELRIQEDTENRSRLYVDGSTESSAHAPRMTISQSDGLGDRRRSPSHDGTYSDVEENWTDLMETIPVVDDNMPSASSSFASDSASSILSRNRPRSSLTNTTNSDSRAGSTELMQSADYSTNCPDAADLRPDITTRRSRTASLAPVRYSPALTSGPVRSRSAVGPMDQETLMRLSENGSQDLDSLDDLMDMIHSGMDVPPEMWAAVGITPHLALRGGAGRHRRRNERL